MGFGDEIIFCTRNIYRPQLLGERALRTTSNIQVGIEINLFRASWEALNFGVVLYLNLLHRAFLSCANQCHLLIHHCWNNQLVFFSDFTFISSLASLVSFHHLYPLFYLITTLLFHLSTSNRLHRIFFLFTPFYCLFEFLFVFPFTYFQLTAEFCNFCKTSI